MSKQYLAVASAIVGLFSAWAVLSAIPHRAMAQDPSPIGQDAIHQPVTFSIDGPTQRLEMVVATSRILTLEHKIPKLLVNDPKVVQATPISPNQVQLSALIPGFTQLNVWDENQGLHTVDIVVSPDGRQLQMLIKSEFPDAEVRVRPLALAGSVYLSGYVPNPAAVNSIMQMAQDYYPKVVNNMTVAGVQQILLKTKVMEVSRTKLREAGFDWHWSAILGHSSVSVVQDVSGVVTAAEGPTVQFGIVDGNNAFNGYIRALRQNNLAKILAEPQLTTVSGRAAQFQAGGQFPMLIAGTVTSPPTYEFKDYGTRVDFVPIVLGNGNIRLEVRPYVSEIDMSRAVLTDGTLVPGLRTRWVDTAVEMKSGQTLALAGLLQTRVESQNRGLPWLADIPWFGAPFRRMREEVNEVELLILVTPEFVEASDPEELPPCGPGESTASPNDVELYLRGYLEVPKCCEDGSCPNCQRGMPSEMSLPGEARPQEALPPQPSDVDASATRPSPQGRPATRKTAQSPTKPVPPRLKVM